MKRIIKHIFCDGWVLNFIIGYSILTTAIFAIVGDYSWSLIHLNFGAIWYCVKVVDKRADKWQKKAYEVQEQFSVLQNFVTLLWDKLADHDNKVYLNDDDIFIEKVGNTYKVYHNVCKKKETQE